MASPEHGTRLTWLDLLLIGAAALAAFAIGASLGGTLATRWFGRVEPRAAFDVRAGVLAHRDAVATIARTQVRLRDRIADGRIAAVAPTPAPSPSPSKPAPKPTPRPVNLKALDREAERLVNVEAKQRVSLGRAELAAARAYAAAQRDRRRQETLARAVVAFVALIALTAVVSLTLALKSLPNVGGGTIAAAAALLLTALLVLAGVGLVAALAVLVAMIVLTMRVQESHP